MSDSLINRPTRYSFLQAVRLLEHIAARVAEQHPDTNRNPVGAFAAPEQELIRFRSHHGLDFPTAQVQQVTPVENTAGRQQWRMQVGFMGLTGAMGALPYHYSELILARLKEKDPTLLHFFELFTHRSVSLFFQASTKYRLPLEYERKRLNPPTTHERDLPTEALLSLIGLGTRHLKRNLGIKDESLLYYGGLFSQKIRSVTGLKQVLRDYFNIPLDIEQFVSQWQPLIDDVRSRLPWRGHPQGRNVRLGHNAMLGRHGWHSQSKIRIVIGPLDHDQFNSFAPGSKALKALHEIVQLYVGLEIDYDLQVRVKRAHMPLRIQLSGEKRPIMGWNTWLSGLKTLDYDADETLDIHLSAQSSHHHRQ